MIGVKTKVFLAIPSTGEIRDDLVYRVREWEERYGDKVSFVWPKQCVRRIFHDFARNALVEEFLDSDCDILWFIDSDVVPPPHTPELITLHQDKWKLAGAPYPVFMAPPGETVPQVIYTVYKDRNGPGMTAASIPSEGTEFVAGLATGCLMIKREVLATMTKPYFEFKFDSATRVVTEGEDLGFCLKMADAGNKFFIDYSMVCAHFKTISLLEVNNYAITYAQKTVEKYEQLIKNQVADLAAAYMRKKQAQVVKQPGVTQGGLYIPGIT